MHAHTHTAGVPIKSPVAGVSIGMVSRPQVTSAVTSSLSGASLAGVSPPPLRPFISRDTAAMSNSSGNGSVPGTATLEKG
jgi:hypothetical protein